MINQDVRNFLIRSARKGQVITYSDINVNCNLGLNFSLDKDRGEIGKILGDISTHEFNENRPLISSIVVYRSNDNDLGLGNGFYSLAEELKFGDTAALKKNNFAELEMKRTFEYWNNKIANNRHTIDFFTKADLIDFQRVAGTTYRKDEQESLDKASVIKPIYEKSNYWGNQLKIKDFVVEDDNRWQSSGYFKSYSWSRIYKKNDKDKLIYFTIGVDKGEDGKNGRLVYKLDCQWANSNPTKRLSEEQILKFRNYLNGSGASWREIDFYTIHEYDWNDLINLARAFIQEYQDLYDELVDLLWSSNEVEIKTGLKLTERPNGRYTEYPTKEYTFKGSERDYNAEHQKKQYIGKKGEKLVLEYERQKLINVGRENLAEDVCKVKDGEGYDVFSYDRKGNVIYIEVKTTKRNAETPFYLSENEIEFMRRNNKKYKIYRIYDLKPALNAGAFYIISDVENNIITKPVQFEVQLKKK